MHAMIRERDSLGMMMNRSTRVAELVDAWLADFAERAKPKTLTNYRSKVRTKVLPSLGRRVVSELTPADVRRMHAAIRASEAGYSSVASAHRTLVTMLEYAKSERVISGENVAMLAPPRRGRVGNAKDSFTHEQAKALLRAEDAQVTLGLLTACFDDVEGVGGDTGPGPGEGPACTPRAGPATESARGSHRNTIRFVQHSGGSPG